MKKSHIKNLLADRSKLLSGKMTKKKFDKIFLIEKSIFDNFQINFDDYKPAYIIKTLSKIDLPPFYVEKLNVPYLTISTSVTSGFSENIFCSNKDLFANKISELISKSDYEGVTKLSLRYFLLNKKF